MIPTLTRTLFGVNGAQRLGLKNPIISAHKTPRDANALQTPPTQNDPHNMRRLRRPTGPRRAAMR
jgi:hypothetical protein